MLIRSIKRSGRLAHFTATAVLGSTPVRRTRFFFLCRTQNDLVYRKQLEICLFLYILDIVFNPVFFVSDIVFNLAVNLTSEKWEDGLTNDRNSRANLLILKIKFGVCYVFWYI